MRGSGQPTRPLGRWIARPGALMALALLVGGVAVAYQGPWSPIIGPTSWSDTLDDAQGLAWLENSQQLAGEVHLNPLEPLSDAVHSIQAVAESPQASGEAFYLGTTEARLWRYDHATGTTVDLGPPVPGECDN